MTIKIHSKNIKDRLKDDVLDLSLCDLQEVPVKEIASIKKATHLDLSNNLLVSLPVNFVTINRLVKLDLSKNMLTELPDNFGELRKLKHLDLYANQISRLPLSLSELKNLRWLDLKDNPLTPAVASVAGPCSNLSECQACARNVVAYLSSVKLTIQEEKQRRLNTTIVGAEKETVPTKKEKKKKKKTTDKENKSINVNGPDIESKPLQNDKSDKIIKQDALNNKYKTKSYSGRGAGFFRGVMKAVLSSLFLIIVLGLILAILPSYDKQRVEVICTYIEKNTGISLKSYQTHSVYVVNIVVQTATELKHHTYNMLSNFYDKYVRDNVERAKNFL